MKVLTLWQPWASLVALGLKIHETRSWSTPYRGPLAIHAAKRPMDEVGSLLLYRLRSSALLPFGFRASRDIPLGCIVALTDLTDLYPACEFEAVPPADLKCGDFSPDRFAWRLENVRRCEVPHKGTLGLQDLPEATARLVREATQGT